MRSWSACSNTHAEELQGREALPPKAQPAPGIAQAQRTALGHGSLESRRATAAPKE
jgi:hypothetical protein